MADRAKYLVGAAQQQKLQIIIKAQGEAKATRLFGESMKQSPVFLELKRIEAARNIAKVIGQGQNRVFLESDSLLMNLTASFNENLERKSAQEQEFDRKQSLERST